MTPTAWIGLVSIAVVILGGGAKALLMLGGIIQRISGLEQGLGALATFEAHKAEVDQRLRSCEVRLRDLEKDHKLQGAALSEFQGEMLGIRKAIEQLQKAVVDLPNQLHKKF